MASISDVAKDYEASTKTKNIADLQKVSTAIELQDDSYEITENDQTKTVKQKIINVDGENYRVPVTVIQQLKMILEDNPDLKHFKVKKSGTTKDDTRYQVIPLPQ